MSVYVTGENKRGPRKKNGSVPRVVIYVGSVFGDLKSACLKSQANRLLDLPFTANYQLCVYFSLI